MITRLLQSANFTAPPLIALSIFPDSALRQEIALEINNLPQVPPSPAMSEINGFLTSN